MASIFSRIATSEIPSYKVAETDRYFAFLDINPVQPGHVLVIPKNEVDYIFDIDDEEFAGLHIFAKKVAKALRKAVPCVKVGVAVIGLEVHHAHIHLIPINNDGDLDFNNKRTLPESEMKAIADAIAAEYAKEA